MTGRAGVDPEPWLVAGRQKSRPVIGTPARSSRVLLSRVNVTIVCWLPHSGRFPQLAREIPGGILRPRPGSRRARPALPRALGRGAAGAGSAPWTYLPPRSSEATAATRQATIAKSNAMASPLENGPEISDGKKVWPVR